MENSHSMAFRYAMGAMKLPKQGHIALESTQ